MVANSCLVSSELADDAGSARQMLVSNTAVARIRGFMLSMSQQVAMDALVHFGSSGLLHRSTYCLELANAKILYKRFGVKRCGSLDK